MTKSEAIEWVRDHDDDDELDHDELVAAWTALYERAPDDEDEERGLWSDCVLAVETDGELYTVTECYDGWMVVSPDKQSCALFLDSSEAVHACRLLNEDLDGSFERHSDYEWKEHKEPIQ